MSRIVFGYGGPMGPIENREQVLAQMRLANMYRNDLTVWLRGARTARREVEILYFGAELEAWRMASRLVVEVVASGATKQRIKDAEKVESAAAEAVREARRRHHDAMQSDIDWINERWLEMTRIIRKVYGASSGKGLCDGTYKMAWDALSASNSDTPLWSHGEPNDPDFVRVSGNGGVGVQLKGGGRSIDQCSGGLLEFRRRASAWFSGEVVEHGADDDTFLRLCPGYTKPTRPGHELHGKRWAERNRTVWIRVGSNADRTPIWAVFPIVYQRPLPTGGQIKECHVYRRLVGPNERWSVQFVIDNSACARKERCGVGAVAVDVGWREIGKERRAAFAVGEDGRKHELRLSEWMVKSLQRASEIESVRDNKLNAMKRSLSDWMRSGVELPEWFLRETVRREDPTPSQKQAIAWFSQWCSKARFARLCKRWADRRFQGDKRGYTILEGWRYRDHHLWAYAAEQRRGALACRLDLYRRWAVGLARMYGVCILERFDKRRVSVKPRPGEDKGYAHGPMSNRVLVCTSELCGALIQAFIGRGGLAKEVEAAFSTQDCPTCGEPQRWDAASDIDRHPPCPKCGCRMDQDEGACRVLLERWLSHPHDAVNAGTPRRRKRRVDPAHEGESKRERMVRQRKDKLERMAKAPVGKWRAAHQESSP